jgi:DNA-binding MarR family transcriptional regulator
VCPGKQVSFEPIAQIGEEILRMPLDSTSPEGIRASLNRKALASARHRAALGRVLGMGEGEVLAIQHLARAGRMTPSQLGSVLRLSSGGATALVQRLEREGHVTRERHPHDRRSVLLRLTPEIEARAGEALAPLVAEIDALTMRLSDAERALVADFLARVADAAERHADELARSADDAAPAAAGSPVPGLWA